MIILLFCKRLSILFSSSTDYLVELIGSKLQLLIIKKYFFLCFRGIKRRQETILLVQSQRPMTNRDQQGLGLCSTFEELILFAIVIIFLLCSLPRVVLNGYELYSIRTIKENIHLDCFRYKFDHFVNCKLLKNYQDWPRIVDKKSPEELKLIIIFR